jgi:insertion element IS1 protein InsB
VFSSASIIFMGLKRKKMNQKTENEASCIRSVDRCKCLKCSSIQTVKNGKTRKGKQRFLCKSCHKTFITDYSYNAYDPTTNQQIILFTKEGLGIRSTARIMKISVTTLLKRIVSIAQSIIQPPIPQGKSYEVDEMRTFVGKKSRLHWIVYALDRETRQVVSFNVGRRTNKTLKRVIKSLELANARKIYTDKLKNYRYLITKKLHNTCVHSTNHIERHNLSIRTHLKRLNRKTICFSRSLVMLVATLKIYFWS